MLLLVVVVGSVVVVAAAVVAVVIVVVMMQFPIHTLIWEASTCDIKTDPNTIHDTLPKILQLPLKALWNASQCDSYYGQHPLDAITCAFRLIFREVRNVLNGTMRHWSHLYVPWLHWYLLQKFWNNLHLLHCNTRTKQLLL